MANLTVLGSALFDVIVTESSCPRWRPLGQASLCITLPGVGLYGGKFVHY